MPSFGTQRPGRSPGRKGGFNRPRVEHGRPGIGEAVRRVGLPFSRWHEPGARVPPMRVFVPYKGRFRITGTTRDGAGAPLGNCDVRLFRTNEDVLVAEGVSDGAGAFTLFVDTGNSGHFYLVAYLAGSPDRAGTSLNTLTLEPTPF